MSSPGQNTLLSPSARWSCYIGPPSVILLTAIASPKTGLFSPLAFLPTAFFLRKWRSLNAVNPLRRGELEHMTWIFAATGTIGLVAAALLQMGVCSAASALLFRSTSTREAFWKEFGRGTVVGLTADEVTYRTKLASSWQNWAFNGVLAFIAAGLVEEVLKYLPIVWARRRGTAELRQRRDRAYVDYALAGALSFGVVENIGFLYAACETGQESWSQFTLTLFERIVVGSLSHLLASLLTALRATRRDYHGYPLSEWGVIVPSVLLHGAFDFVAMSASAAEGNVGWIHPTGFQNTAAMFGLISGVVSTAAWQVWQNWKALDDRDQRRE